MAASMAWREDIVMAAMCNRGDALMYATETSQAAARSCELRSIWSKLSAKRLARAHGARRRPVVPVG